MPLSPGPSAASSCSSSSAIHGTRAHGVGATGMNMDAVSHSGPRSAVSLELLGWVVTELVKLCSRLRPS